MKSTTRAALCLMIIPPLMMELLTGNLPVLIFFQPVIVLVLLFGYSLPIVILRDLSVRWNIGLIGTFVLGILYGIINEGLGAKTLLMNQNVPTPSFDNYGYFWGINFPFSAYVLVIQSLVSVAVPFLIVKYLYPELNNVPLLGKKTTIALSISCALVIIGIFLSPHPVQADPLYFIVFSVIGSALLLMARSARGPEESAYKCGINPLFSGMLFMIVFGIGLDLLASMKIPVALFFLSWFSILYAAFTYIKKKKWLSTPALLLFGIGIYSILGITGTINMVILKDHAEGIFTGLLFEMAFIIAVIRINRRNSKV
jgi:hypothetical protein